MTRLVTARRLSPWRHRIAPTGSFSFTAAVRVIDGVHCYTANVRTDSTPTRPTRLAERNIFVLDVSDLADGRATFDGHAAHFTGRHAQLGVQTFLRQQLRERTSRARHLSALARPQLDVMNLRAKRNAANW